MFALTIRIFSVLAMAAALCATASAQNFPSKPIRIVANFGADPPGGSAEDFVRAMKADASRADELADLLRASGYKPE